MELLEPIRFIKVSKFFNNVIFMPPFQANRHIECIAIEFIDVAINILLDSLPVNYLDNWVISMLTNPRYQDKICQLIDYILEFFKESDFLASNTSNCQSKSIKKLMRIYIYPKVN